MCGVFGVTGHADAARLTYLGLYALQHRGQEAAGIVAVGDGKVHQQKGPGEVGDFFTGDRLDKLPGSQSIGHTRYSTAGDSSHNNIQPIVDETAFGRVALCHNGNLVNAVELKTELMASGTSFHTNSDSEVMLKLFVRELVKQGADDLIECLAAALKPVKGAFSILILMQDGTMLAARDSYGFRPLVIGKLDDAFVFASETCAIDLIDGIVAQEVFPGQIVLVKDGKCQIADAMTQSHHAKCVFEHVYFSRPDSLVFGQRVKLARDQMGAILAREAPVEADVVVPVPDSGVTAALGFARASRIPFDLGLIRNHYVGRTFIEPRPSIRHFGVKVKLNPVRESLQGKRVVLIDDSLVRGTTSRKIVKMVRGAGAREVHVRISSPPTVAPCFYGIDTPTRSELIAASHSVEEIRKQIEADSLAYLSSSGLLEAVEGNGYCTACFTGEYPVPFPQSS